MAIERLADNLGLAVDVFLDACHAEGDAGADHATRIKGAREIADRVLGRATQRTEVFGSIDHTVEHRSRLAGLVSDHAERARQNGHS